MSAHKKNIIQYCEDYVLINNIKFDIEDLEYLLSLNRYIGIMSNGYPYVTINNETIFIHRLLMGVSNRYDKNTKIIVDHINGDILDCRKSNLRIITKDKNPINCKTYSNNTSNSNCNGVRWNKNNNNWVVYIGNKYLGTRHNLEDAIKLRKEAEKEYYGEYCRK